MYKYSKLVKENFFKDNVMSFLWIFFRLNSDSSSQFEQEEIDPEEKV
jgi:hypothetical protein